MSWSELDYTTVWVLKTDKKQLLYMEHLSMLSHIIKNGPNFWPILYMQFSRAEGWWTGTIRNRLARTRTADITELLVECSQQCNVQRLR